MKKVFLQTKSFNLLLKENKDFKEILGLINKHAKNTKFLPVL